MHVRKRMENKMGQCNFEGRITKKECEMHLKPMRPLIESKGGKHWCEWFKLVYLPMRLQTQSLSCVKRTKSSQVQCLLSLSHVHFCNVLYSTLRRNVKGALEAAHPRKVEFEKEVRDMLSELGSSFHSLLNIDECWNQESRLLKITPHRNYN